MFTAVNDYLSETNVIPEVTNLGYLLYSSKLYPKRPFHLIRIPFTKETRIIPVIEPIDGVYQCVDCANLKIAASSTKKVPTFFVSRGRFLFNPDITPDPHFCRESKRRTSSAQDADSDEPIKGDQNSSELTSTIDRLVSAVKYSETGGIKDYGEVRYNRFSLYGDIRFESVQSPGKIFIYTTKISNESAPVRKKADLPMYYFCRGCIEMRLRDREKSDRIVPSVVVLNGRYKTDPEDTDPNYPHFCDESSMDQHDSDIGTVPEKDETNESSVVPSLAWASGYSDGLRSVLKAQMQLARISCSLPDVNSLGDYGPLFAVFGSSGQSDLFYYSEKFPGSIVKLQFIRRNGSGAFYYACSRCVALKKTVEKFNKALVPMFSVRNGRCMPDPDNPPNSHFCDFNYPTVFGTNEEQSIFENDELSGIAQSDEGRPETDETVLSELDRSAIIAGGVEKSSNPTLKRNKYLSKSRDPPSSFTKILERLAKEDGVQNDKRIDCENAVQCNNEGENPTVTGGDTCVMAVPQDSNLLVADDVPAGPSNSLNDARSMLRMRIRMRHERLKKGFGGLTETSNLQVRKPFGSKEVRAVGAEKIRGMPLMTKQKLVRLFEFILEPERRFILLDSWRQKTNSARKQRTVEWERVAALMNSEFPTSHCSGAQLQRWFGYFLREAIRRERHHKYDSPRHYVVGVTGEANNMLTVLEKKVVGYLTGEFSDSNLPNKSNDPEDIICLD